jgi:ABC-2 type transport system ATP-binding protein
MSASIVVSELSKRYKGAAVPALDGVGFAVEGGEIFGVVGPNGAGKTTLFGCLLGHLHFDGSVQVEGLDPRDPEARRHLGYVPERLTFEAWMKAEAFVGFHYDLSGMAPAGRAEAVSDALHKVGIDRVDWGKQVAKFSRGNLQRLALAQAIVARPQVLFLDEPTSGMDPLGVLRFKEIVRELARGGCTVIFNSHQLAQVQDLCQRVLLLEKGQVLRVETLKQGHASNALDRFPYAIRWIGPKDAAERVKKVSDKLKLRMQAEGSEGVVLQVKDEAQGSQALALLVRAGVKVAQAGMQVKDLEQEFDQAYGRRP